MTHAVLFANLIPSNPLLLNCLLWSDQNKNNGEPVSFVKKALVSLFPLFQLLGALL